MKILILSSEVWNDKINGNNILSNWFEGTNVELANIYCEPGQPYNKCCEKYFQVTDAMMARSIISKQRAGMRVNVSDGNESMAEAEPKKLYSALKKISGSWLRFCRELLWSLGRYNLIEMRRFIEEFQPDVIFSERMASCKMLRLEKIVTNITAAPIVAFTGDDEYSLRQFSFSPSFWINRYMIRKRLREMVQKYSLYYTLSLEQKIDYEKRFGCRMKILQKCGSFEKEFIKREVHSPIKMIYAGKFYCNRWKVLSQLVEEIKEINKDSVKIILEIYTRDIPTKRQKKKLDDGINSRIVGGVTQEELKNIYQNSDIALHVESQDIKNRLATRLSFSTKIIDCLESGCAIMAICWNQHSGYTYLKRENAAMCVCSRTEIKEMLQQIVENPKIISSYAEKAYLCGMRKHNKNVVQKTMMDNFGKIVSDVKK